MRIGLLERWRRKRDEKRVDAAISREIERIAVKSKAGFLTIGGYSKKLTGPAKNALKYIQDNIARIPEPVALDPERWDSDNTLHTLFVDRKAVRDFSLSSKRLQTYFEGCGEARAMALMTADWRQKTTLGIEKAGEIIRRDVPQQAYYFEEHRIVEVEASLEKVREQLSIRILSALIVKVVMEIQGLQEWNQDLEQEQDMLELFIHHSHGTEPASGKNAGETRLAEAKELLSSIEQKERDLRGQIGDARAQLKKVEEVLLIPRPFFTIQPVTLHLNRLGIEVKQHSSDPAFDITLAKCELVDQHPKAILWVQVDR
jgi:hypothetical protein